MSIFRRKPQPDLQVEVTIRIEGGDDGPVDREGAAHLFYRDWMETKADIDALPEKEQAIQ